MADPGLGVGIEEVLGLLNGRLCAAPSGGVDGCGKTDDDRCRGGDDAVPVERDVQLTSSPPQVGGVPVPVPDYRLTPRLLKPRARSSSGVVDPGRSADGVEIDVPIVGPGP